MRVIYFILTKSSEMNLIPLSQLVDLLICAQAELVLLNPYGDQESMPRHQFRQPM
jgi:hypothetical protein